MPATFIVLWYMRACARLLVLLLTSCALWLPRVTAAPPAPAASSTHPRLPLTPLERMLIARQLVRGLDHVLLYLMARVGHSRDVADRVTALPGTVLMLEPDVDFLRVQVPIAAVPAIAAWKDVTALRIDTGYLLDASIGTSDKPGASPTADTPRDNPFTGEAATESLQLKTRHPTYDGRGVVIGGVEPVDAAIPSLTWASSLDGVRIPKLTDYIMLPPAHVSHTAEAPQEQTRLIDWQRTSVVDAKECTLPEEATGELRLARFRFRADGVPPSILVLWSVDTGKLWVDDSGRGRFDDRTPLVLPRDRPFAAAIGLLPSDQTRTLRLAVDTPQRTLGIELLRADHGTMCAAVALGHTFLNSRAEGVAPGAQLLVVDNATEPSEAGEAPTTVARSWLALFRDPRVDVITNSTALFSARQQALDSTLVERQLFDRLFARYPKPFFSAVGNSGPQPGDINLGADASSSVIVVGAYTPPETWQANFGVTPTMTDTPAPYSAFGPAADGGFKPDILSLTGTLSAGIARAEYADRFASPYFPSVPGYLISGGTSAATPHAAGHAALLISAARQAGVPDDLARLKVALFSTARFLDGVEARIQGHGLVQIARAWDALQRLRDFAPPEFATEAPVRTFYSDQFTTPHVGRGLYERTGWAPGQTGDRGITITRLTGPDRPITYALQWQGDRAFRSPASSITLALNVPVKLPIQIAVEESRAYSALLNLVDTSVNLTVHSVMCAVIAAEQLTPARHFTARVDRIAPRPGNGFMFVNVPEGVDAIRVRVTQQGGRHVSLRALTPDEHVPREESLPSAPWRLLASDRQTYDQTFVRPQPGVWQFWITHDDGVAPASFDPAETRPATACAFRMEVSAASLDLHTTRTGALHVVNRGIPIDRAQATSLGIGVMREERFLLGRALAPKIYDLTVDPGTSRLEIAVDSDADVSMALFAIPEKEIVRDVSAGGRKQLVLTDPPPGKYKVAIDAWRGVPPAGAIVRYREVIFHPRYGALHIPARVTRLDPGRRRTVPYSWSLSPRLADDRRPVAGIGILADGYVTMRSNFRELAAAKLPLSQQRISSHPVPIATVIVPLPDRR